jgi:hypothetical protein
VVNGVVASKDDGITESFVFVVDRNLCSDTVLSALEISQFISMIDFYLFGSEFHFIENSQIFLDGTVAALTFDTVHAFLSHLK